MQAQQALLNVPWDEHVLALPGCQAAVDGERRLLFSGPRVRMGRLPRCMTPLCSTRLWVTAPGCCLGRAGLHPDVIQKCAFVSVGDVDQLLVIPLQMGQQSYLSRWVTSHT